MAGYNPRAIDEWARKKLRDEIRDHGVVNKFVWNERTGVLVGGHQRLSILDELEGGTDYHLEVDAISVSPHEERRLNVFLNNPGTQGAWDLPKLAELIEGDGIKPEDMGFDLLELQEAFADTGLLQTLFDEPEELKQVVETLNDMGERVARLENGEAVKDPERLKEVVDARDKMREKLAAVNAAGESDFFVVVVFGSFEEREAAMKGLGQSPDEMYLDGRKLMSKLNIPLPKVERA